jgi:hypothetical protein
MSYPKVSHRLLLALVASASFSPFAFTRAEAASTYPVMDWFTQDVCVNSKNQIQTQESPVNQSCTTHRDLAIGESLPYHKQDLGGQVWEDSVPVNTAAYGPAAIVVEDNAPTGTFDFGDGAQLTVPYLNTSNPSLDAVSWVVGNDHNGVHVYEGPLCGTVGAPVNSPDSFIDSWIISNIDGTGKLIPTGPTTASLIAEATTQFTCVAPNHALTQWLTQPINFTMKMPWGTKQVTLNTLIATHAGIGVQNHAERNFFTKELGRMLWEEWVDTNSATYAKAPQANIAANCPDATQYMTPPYNNVAQHWIITSCREATKIVWANGRGGLDAPPTSGSNNFLQELQGSPLTHAIFNTPAQGPKCALSVQQNQNVTYIVWGSHYAASGSIDNGIGTLSAVGNGAYQIPTPTTNVTFTGTFYSPDTTSFPKPVTCSVVASPPHRH